MIRVDTEEKLSVLTVQDVGQIMPGGRKASPVGLTIFHVSYLCHYTCAGEKYQCKMMNRFKVV